MSIKFKEQFPNYQTFSNNEFLMNRVNYDLLKELSYKIPKLLIETAQVHKGLNLDGTLRNMADTVSGHTNNDKTQNWGWDFIIKDFEEQFLDFVDLKFHKFMDCILDLEKFFLNPIKDFNDIFEERDFGYRLTENPEKPWRCVNPAINMSMDIEEVILSTTELCEQTAQHIKQAKEQLTRAHELRPRKDAIRDCLSAMEALMKHLTNAKDVEQAEERMRADNEKWGQGFIVKDGLILWKMFHNKFKDIRHGNFDISEISYDEAIYFVDKLLAYVKYISARAIASEKEEELIF